MDKSKKLELLKRQLGLRHKLKVHDSTKPPETHEEIATNLIAKWDFEDEIQAIDEILDQARQQTIREKRDQLMNELNRSGKLTKSWAEKREFHDGVRHSNGNGTHLAAATQDGDESNPEDEGETSMPSSSRGTVTPSTPSKAKASSKSGSTSRKN